MHRDRLRLLSLVCAGLVVLASSIVTLQSWLLPDGIALVDTNLILLAAGASVLLFHARHRLGTAPHMLASLLSLILFVVSLFSREAAEAPLTSGALLLLIVSLLMLRDAWLRSRQLIDWFGAVAIVLSGTTLIALMFGVNEIEGFQRLLVIDPTTALVLVLLGASVLFADPSHGIADFLSRDDAAGRMVRWFLPNAIVSTILLGLAVKAARDEEWFSRAFSFPLFVELELILLILLVWRTAVKFRILDDERAEAVRKVQIAKDELESRVEQRTVELRRLNAELESFSYSISHDLRAPLRAIHGFSKILRDDYNDELDPEARRYLDIIGQNTETMGRLISDLLAFSRLSRLEVRGQVLDMERMVAEAFEIAAEQTASPPRLVTEKIPPAVADPSMVRQVLENLLSNSIKYSETKRDTVIRVYAEEVRNFNRYLVRDQGVGFDMQYADKLFGVFQRLHHADQFEGTGVGLSIVKRIVEKHGGEVGAESTPGEGATFWFTLPAAGKVMTEEERHDG